MEIVLHLAMTAAEIEKCRPLPNHLGWMACHFSPYGIGLSNLPQSLPPGSLLIVNDRTPICGHDPAQIAQQLAQAVETFQCCGILLDLQRPGAQQVAAAVASLPCPVAVTPDYAAGLQCAVFLPPPPLTVSLPSYLERWQGRVLWLEAATEETCIQVTAEGSHVLDAKPIPCPHIDEKLHCRYGMELHPDSVHFYLRRDTEQLLRLMEEGAQLGIERFVGLYQQLGCFSSQAEAQATARFQS